MFADILTADLQRMAELSPCNRDTSRRRIDTRNQSRSSCCDCIDPEPLCCMTEDGLMLGLFPWCVDHRNVSLIHLIDSRFISQLCVSQRLVLFVFR